LLVAGVPYFQKGTSKMKSLFICLLALSLGQVAFAGTVAVGDDVIMDVGTSYFLVKVAAVDGRTAVVKHPTPAGPVTYHVNPSELIKRKGCLDGICVGDVVYLRGVTRKNMNDGAVVIGVRRRSVTFYETEMKWQGMYNIRLVDVPYELDEKTILIEARLDQKASKVINATRLIVSEKNPAVGETERRQSFN
jgi:hypothetical protein